MDDLIWKKCNSCKKEIPYGAKYFKCSVSTCNQRPFNYVFCSVGCFERHLPGARHKDAAAINEVAPSFKEAQAASAPAGQPTRRIVSGGGASSSAVLPQDILIVVSKMKDYVKAKADLNTSGDVAEALSHIVRLECNRAIENAIRDGRKILMKRDFEA